MFLGWGACTHLAALSFKVYVLCLTVLGERTHLLVYSLFPVGYPISPNPVFRGVSGKGLVNAFLALGHAKQGGLWPTGSGDNCLGDHLLGVWSVPGQQRPGTGRAHDSLERLLFRTVKWVL